VLGVALTAVVDHRARRHVSEEQREQARHARELIAAEQLDQAMLNTSAALDLDSGRPLEERYIHAHTAWEEGWVAFSPRIGKREVLDRYNAVGSILKEVVHSSFTPEDVQRRTIVRAIANARSTLAHFMRGDRIPPSAFPEPEELKRLLGEGNGLDDPMKPLKDWMTNHPEPDFH
jgi:hypothetical protein